MPNPKDIKKTLDELKIEELPPPPPDITDIGRPEVNIKDLTPKTIL